MQEIHQRKETGGKTLPGRLRSTLTAATLSISLLLSPCLTPKASAYAWWLRLAAALFTQFIARSLYDSVTNPATASPSVTYAQAIKDKLSEGLVDYSNGTSVFLGRVDRVWEQKGKQNLDDNGIAGKIQWEDGVVSTILFVDRSRVRVWSSGKEYRGHWGWQDGTLYVKMNAGGFYRFR